MHAFAAAKVNLFLHVGPPRADGFHPVCSLMVFADVGDEVQAHPAPDWSITVRGPFGGAAGPDVENLALRAGRALGGSPVALVLDKRLPVGAGLGGGSADAAAVLRLLSQGRDDVDEDQLHQIAAGLGSDVPACLRAQPVLGEGRGEVLTPGPLMTPVSAVLVHPGPPSSTAAVYRAYDACPNTADRPDLPERLASAAEVARLMGETRNDLEAPAVALEPAIAETLAALREAPESLVARMSGSGSACFALCENGAAAHGLAGRLSATHPHWWTAACVLG